MTACESCLFSVSSLETFPEVHWRAPEALSLHVVNVVSLTKMYFESFPVLTIIFKNGYFSPSFNRKNNTRLSPTHDNCFGIRYRPQPSTANAFRVKTHAFGYLGPWPLWYPRPDSYAHAKLGLGSRCSADKYITGHLSKLTGRTSACWWATS